MASPTGAKAARAPLSFARRPACVHWPEDRGTRRRPPARPPGEDPPSFTPPVDPPLSLSLSWG